MNPELENLEKVRKAAIINRVTKYVVCIGIPLLIGIWAGISQEEFISGLAGFIFPWMFISTLWAKLAKNRALAEYRSTFKKVLIESALNGGALYEDMEFEYDAGLQPALIFKSGLFTTDKYFSDCYLSGVTDGVKFIQADVRNVRTSKDGSSLEYDGTFLAFPTSLPDATQTNIYHKDADVCILVAGKELKIGNDSFDSMFKVNSSQPDKARALINEEFIRRLTDLQNRTGRRIVMTVKQGWLYAFWPNKNSVLKPKLFKKYDASMNNEIIKELSIAQEFIRAFK